VARIGFLGTGEIAAHMVRGLAGQGHAIRVSARNATVAADLARTVEGVTIHPNAEVVAGSDIVVLCLMARVADDVLPGLPFRADQAVISVMVDCPLERLATLCAPATDIALTIPLPAIAKGGCPLPVFPESAALTALYGDRNPILPVRDEAALNAHFIATALCSPILRQAQEGAAWLSRRTGDPAQAETYVATLLAGAFRDIGSGEGFARALDALATEGGLNATLRAAMEEAGAPDTLRRGMAALAPRLGLDPE
jgi:pyrroline-5-carboxylate reductase